MNLSSVMIDLFGHQRQVFLRSESIGDSGAYQQVITNEDYKVDFWAQGLSLDQYYKSLISKGVTPLIVDLGANIGMSALYFACRYPKAKIYAIEPNNANFSMLKMNLPAASSGGSVLEILTFATNGVEFKAEKLNTINI